jgi:hypothetical protein
MNNFTANFDVSNYQELDRYALEAHQDNNLGNRGNWFFNFRGGLFGFYSRLYGVKIHYDIMHAWLPIPRITDTEYHLSSCFFNMDSAIECLTFALNAIGYAISPKHFRDITSNYILKKISPKDIIGYENKKNRKDVPPPGYENFFPNLHKLWQSHEGLINTIMEQHDVSKHRETIYVGGQCRLDVPENFFESLGTPDDPSIRGQYWPMAEIILKNDPKIPNIDRQTQEVKDFIYLENLIMDFEKFIKQTGICALSDIQEYFKNNVKLKSLTCRY